MLFGISLIAVAIFIALPILYYKFVLPLIESIYKLFLLIGGAIAFWIGSGFILYLFGSTNSDSGIIGILIAAIVGAIFSTPAFLIAKIYSRLESLEKDKKSA